MKTQIIFTQLHTFKAWELRLYMPNQPKSKSPGSLNTSKCKSIRVMSRLVAI